MGACMTLVDIAAGEYFLSEDPQQSPRRRSTPVSSSFAGRTACNRTARIAGPQDIGPGTYTSELLHHSGRRLTWQRPVSCPFKSKRDRFSPSERLQSSVGPGSYESPGKVGVQKQPAYTIRCNCRRAEFPATAFGGRALPLSCPECVVAA